MLNMRFSKTDSAIYISHIDVLRGLSRTFRRMAVPIEYSKGYNPRMLVNFSQPLPLGIGSKAEWVSIETQFSDANSFLSLYNEFATPGFEGLECFYTTTKPNIAGKVMASDYYISTNKAIEFRDKIEDINKSPFIMEAKTKTGVIDRDMSPLIFDIKVDDGGIYCRLAFGNINLRIDNLSAKISEMFDLDISHIDVTRLCQLVDINGKMFEVSEYLKELQ